MMLNTLQAATGGAEHKGFKRWRQTGEMSFFFFSFLPPHSLKSLHFIFMSNGNAALTCILPLRLRSYEAARAFSVLRLHAVAGRLWPSFCFSTGGYKTSPQYWNH